MSKNTFKFSVTPSEITKELKKGNSVTTFVEKETTHLSFVDRKAMEVTFIPDEDDNAEIQINNVFGGDKDDVFHWTKWHCKSWAVLITGFRSSWQKPKITLLDFDGRVINGFLKGALN